jgi:hypothetical protein
LLSLSLGVRIITRVSFTNPSADMQRLVHYGITFILLSALYVFAPHAAEAQSSTEPPLQGKSLYGSAELGGPAGGYTLALRHLFIRTPQLHLGLQVGGSFSQNVVWDGTATALTAGALAARRIGALGDTPVALEGGLGVTRVHEDLCDEGNCTGVVSRRTLHVYASSALRVTTMNGRLSYRLGVVTLMSDSDPFVLPLLGVGVGLF